MSEERTYAPRMNDICANCGLTWGSHCGDGRGPLCPSHEGRMDFDAGPGTSFEPAGHMAIVPWGRAASVSLDRPATLTDGEERT